MQSVGELVAAFTNPPPRHRTTNRALWLKLNFTVKAARLQTLKRQKYQHLQEEALLKARGLLKNWENGVVVLTEDLYRRAAGERDAQELMNYTPEALALRFSLRNDPHVLEAVKQLWQIEMARDSLGCIDQRGYASVFRRVAKSLDAAEFKKKQKLDRLLDDDWTRDSKGEPSMSFANFFDSIFELADLWCETIDASDYVAFLQTLRDRISHVRRGKRTFKPMAKVTAFEADSDDEEEEEQEQEQEQEQGQEEQEDEQEADQEEDQDRECEQEESRVDAKRSAPVPAPQPRILVAKSILRPVSQPQKQPLHLLGKVTRVAMSSNKAGNRQRGTGAAAAKSVPATTPQLAIASPPSSTPLAEIIVPTVATMVDTVPPLLQHASSRHIGAQQRRASVVTTIQFLDDGFVRSISSGLGDEARVEDLAPQSSLSAGNLASGAAAAAVFAAAATRRGTGTRPSLATAAAAALGRSREEASEAATPTSRVAAVAASAGKEATEMESGSISSNDPSGEPRDERRRVITVSTPKHSILKSIVFAAGNKASENATSGHAIASTVGPTGHHDGEMSATHVATPASRPKFGAVAGATNSTSGGGAIAASNGVAVRIRSGSVFSLGISDSRAVHPTKRARQGIGTVANGAMRATRGGGLAPLVSSPTRSTASGVPPVPVNANLMAVGAGNTNGAALSAISSTMTSNNNGPHSYTSFSSPGTGSLDCFSDSVVMTSYGMDPSALSPLLPRPPTVLGTPASGNLQRAPPMATTHEEGVLRGQRAATKPVASPQRNPLKAEAAPSTELALKKTMVLILNNKPPDSASLEKPPRHAGGNSTAPSRTRAPAAHGQLQSSLSLVSHNGPDGTPEQALHIRAALDHERGQSPTLSPPSQQVKRVDYEHVYGHTEPGNLPTAAVQLPPFPHKDTHGMMIQSFPSTTGAASRVHATSPSSKPRELATPAMDSLATPWDTYDDDGGGGSGGSGGLNSRDGLSMGSARSLLQPETATEVLAKMISKRTASYSAGSTGVYTNRGSSNSDDHSGEAVSTGKRRRSRPVSRDLRESDVDQVCSTHGDDNDAWYTYREESPVATQSVQPSQRHRSRLLTVCALGGGSVESDHHLRRVTQRGSREIGASVTGMHESVSSPVLLTIGQLKLDGHSNAYHEPARNKTSHSTTGRDFQQENPQYQSPHRLGFRHGLHSIDDLELRGEHAFDPAVSPPRSPPTRAKPTTTTTMSSSASTCTCSRNHHESESMTGEPSCRSSSLPPPRFRLDLDLVLDVDPSSGEVPACCAPRDPEATIILNATRALTLVPTAKELDVIAQAAREAPRRSEMMRRRHRYTRGKPGK